MTMSAETSFKRKLLGCWQWNRLEQRGDYDELPDGTFPRPERG